MIAILLLAQAQLFSDANAAYLSGDVQRATSAYEALVAEGVASATLETNLGAAYLRQGKRGLAALHFERALFLDPGDDDARADLAELRRGNVDKLEGESDEGGAEALIRVLAPLPGSAAAIGFLLAWAAGWTLLGLRLLRPSRHPLGAWAAASFALSAVCALVTWGAATGRRLALERAVVVAPSAAAREGPQEKSVSHFEVHEGTTVRVEDEESSFRRVKLANGLTGWVPSGAVELVVPPTWSGRPQPSASTRASVP
jgi:tetratricopeptide (TPR) repeat protein